MNEQGFLIPQRLKEEQVELCLFSGAFLAPTAAPDASAPESQGAPWKTVG